MALSSRIQVLLAVLVTAAICQLQRSWNDLPALTRSSLCEDQVRVNTSTDTWTGNEEDIIIEDINEKRAVNTSAKTDTVVGQETICGWLRNQAPLAVWNENSAKIHAASQSPLDSRYKIHDQTAQVLQIVTPRLRNSFKSSLRDWKGLQEVIQKADRRMKYLRTSDSSLPEEPPVQIVVFGGSVTMGVNCDTKIRGYAGLACAWSTRLETLLNQLAGGTVVEIHNLAGGGTNSGTGRVIFEYGLLPDYARSPDIIINAYSTNDMHAITIREAREGNVTLRERTMTMAQEFTRAVLQYCSGENKKPLLLWMNDYTGNEQRQILASTELLQGLHVLANYYGFGLISYADAIRDLVYGSTRESTFSPAGWYKGNKNTMQREIHPPFTTHIALSYMVAFYMLQVSSDYCQFEAWNLPDWESNPNYHNTTAPGMPAIRDGLVLQNPPKPVPRGRLPPLLTPSLSLENVSQLWEESDPLLCTQQDLDYRRCPVSWISGFTGPSLPESVMKYFRPYIVEPLEWEWYADGNRGKYGFLPVKGIGSVLTLSFPLTQEINTVTLLYFKSYGPGYFGSLVEASVYADDDTQQDPVATLELTGYHVKRTSETFSEEIQLPVAAKKEIRFVLKHKAGKKFKLMGIAICS